MEVKVSLGLYVYEAEPFPEVVGDVGLATAVVVHDVVVRAILTALPIQKKVVDLISVVVKPGCDSERLTTIVVKELVVVIALKGWVTLA